MRGRRAPLARVVASLVAIVALAAATPTGAEAAASAPNAPAATPAARPGAASRDARSVEAMPAAGVTAALGDPLASAECQRALAVLKEEEAAVAEWSRASGGVTTDERRLIDARLAPARRNAARSCLARRADPPTLASERLVRPAPITTPPFAVAPPPITTPPLAVAPASGPAPTPATARAAPLASPTAPAERPYAITSCDPGGCWANDGSRLNRVGPNLWGARGICTVQGSLVQCP